MATFPKLRPEALVVRSAVAAIPVPLKETVFGELETSVITETLPEMAPAALGEKITLNVACFPAAIVRGSEIPVIVTPARRCTCLRNREIRSAVIRYGDRLGSRIPQSHGAKTDRRRRD